MLDRIDYIVVPSYTVRSRARPTSQTASALDLAYSTYTTAQATNPDLKIILSTGDNQNLGVSNARIMADYLIAKGMPESALILEEKSQDTYENLRESLKIIRSQMAKSDQSISINIIAYDLHMPRIQLIAGMQKWPAYTSMPASGPAESAYGWRAFQTSSRPMIRIYEACASVYELIRWFFR